MTGCPVATRSYKWGCQTMFFFLHDQCKIWPNEEFSVFKLNEKVNTGIDEKSQASHK
jgi:hypothetical protein